MEGNHGALPCITLGEDRIPAMAIGTYGHDLATLTSLFRAYPYKRMMIDTAARYGNETDVALALSDAGWDNNDVIVIGKLARADQERMPVAKAAKESLARLGMDSFDIYLIHSPRYPGYVDTWEEMLALREARLARHVGVSNFNSCQLLELHRLTGVWPQVNQLVLNAGVDSTWWEVADFCLEKGIMVQAVMPFGGPSAPPLVGGEDARGEVLRSNLRRGIVSVPGTSSPAHLLENLRAYQRA